MGLIVLGVAYGLLLLLWLVAAVPALVGLIPGRFSPAAVVVPWIVVVVGWFGIPVACVIALDALTAGVLDGRALLPPLAIGVMVGGAGLGAAVVAISGLVRRRRPEAAPGPDPHHAVVDVPEPWSAYGPLPVRGVRALGFAEDPTTARELMLVVTSQGSGVFDVASGTRLARDDDPDPGLHRLETAPDSDPATTRRHYPGLGPLEGRRVGVVRPGHDALPVRAGGWSVALAGGRSLVVLGREEPGRPEGASWTVAAFPAPVETAGFSPSGRTVVAVADAGLWWSTRP